jgi:lipoprotein NlpD
VRPDPGPRPVAASAGSSTASSASATSAAAAQRTPRHRAASEDPRPESYIVKRGDTLYSIALDNGVEYRELAEWNDLEDANRIRIGQSLRLRAPGSVAGADGVQTRPILSSAAPEARALDEAPALRPLPGASQPTTPAAVQPATQPATPAVSTSLLRSGPLARKLPYSEQNLALLSKPEPAALAPSSASASVASPAASATPTLPAAQPAAQPAPQAAPGASAANAQANTDGDGDDDNIDWAWPSNGKLLAGFSEPANKGIDLAGRIGDPVLAAAAGKVVYSGQGLRGYGKLVIIKHNKTFLSAYAHNSNILVKEGQSVTRGQRIAEIGNTDSDSPKLHFEIRRFGKPTDPIKFLPAR